LFDLWTAERLAQLDPERVIACFERYLGEGGQRVRRAEFEANLASKLADTAFTQDIEPLLAPTIQWDVEEVARFVREELLARLSGEPWKGADGGM
jgi:hypothetical protein